MKKRLIGLLAAGHIVTDINQGALPALLPFLIVKHGLSYTSAAALILAANISSSVIQPAFGHYADRISALWLMPFGIFLAGAGLALAGVVPSYWLIVLCVAVSGIGVAAYHPEAARLVNISAGKKKATGVSAFSAGGNLGFAFGPIVATLLLSAFGTGGTLLLLVPATVLAVLFAVNLQRIAASKDDSLAQEEKRSGGALPPDDWKAFAKLTGAVTCRSILFFGLNTFLPLYWIDVLKQSRTAGSAALTGLLLLGACVTLITGRLADRYGHRKMITLGFGAMIPFLLLFAHCDRLVPATILLVPVGVSLFASFSPMVVLGQRYVPRHMGLASGVTMGLAISVGGIFAPLWGLVADHFGLKAVMEALVILPVIALFISLKLPPPGRFSSGAKDALPDGAPLSLDH